MRYQRSTSAPTDPRALAAWLGSELDRIAAMINSEEGVFSPILAGGTTAGVGTYSLQWGQYSRLNRLVLVQYRVQCTAHTGTGQAQITNLPFRVYSPSVALAGYHVGAVWSAFQAVQLSIVSPGATTLQFFGANPSTAINIAAGNSDFVGSIAYLTDEG